MFLQERMLRTADQATSLGECRPSKEKEEACLVPLRRPRRLRRPGRNSPIVHKVSRGCPLIALPVDNVPQMGDQTYTSTSDSGQAEIVTLSTCWWDWAGREVPVPVYFRSLNSTEQYRGDLELDRLDRLRKSVKRNMSRAVRGPILGR